MVDVFISYSRANQEVVRRLAEAVRRSGYVVWWDDELPPHRSYSEVITEKIGEAKAAIVVWSGGSIGSEWVRAEADLARNQKKLIQTSIDDCMPPMPFNQIQFASLAGWDGGDDHPGWTKVKGSLAALCGAASDVRPAFPMPDRPPPPAQAIAAPPPPARVRPAARRSGVLTGALIGGSLVVIAGVGLLVFTRDREPPVVSPPARAATISATGGNAVKPAERPPVATPAPAPAPAVRRSAPAVRQPQPQRAAETTMPMRPRRYCMGPGRGTPECMQRRRMRFERR